MTYLRIFSNHIRDQLLKNLSPQNFNDFGTSLKFILLIELRRKFWQINELCPKFFQKINIFMLFVLTHSPLDIDGNLTKICLDSTSRISAYSKNYLKIFNQCISLSSIDFFDKFDQKCLAMGPLYFRPTRTPLYWLQRTICCRPPSFRKFNPHWSAFVYTLNLWSTRKLLFWVQWVICCRMTCISVPFYLLFRI